MADNIKKSESSEGLTGKAVNISGLVSYQDGSVVSRMILKKDTGNITIFAFDAGQGLSEHTAPFDAHILIVEGKADITIEKNVHTVNAGEMIILPANKPHAVAAKERFKMVLTMIKK